MYGFKIFKADELRLVELQVTTWVNAHKVEIISHNLAIIQGNVKETDNNINESERYIYTVHNEYIITIIYKY